MSDEELIRSTIDKAVKCGGELMRQSIIGLLLREADLTDATRFWLIEKIKEVPLP